MNDRPQGGSADLQKATIELMHHRRLLKDDKNGVEEYLNETDQGDNGIRVSARYYMQIFDWTKGGSKQRTTQINLEQPLQYLFAFDFAKDEKAKILPVPKKASDDIAIKQFVKEGNLRLYPMDKNQIIVRAENLGDQFDGLGSPTFYLNMQKYARELYVEVNNGLVPTSISVEETSLSSNMPLSQILSDKWMWRGIDDANSLTSLIEAPTDRGGARGIALNAQRLRAFTITYNSDPNGMTHTFRRPRPSSESSTPYSILRKKE